jgi:hypothetical protein
MMKMRDDRLTQKQKKKTKKQKQKQKQIISGRCDRSSRR